ncbi:MAG: SAM-dependent methyltransferase [Chloroflexota bacterium]
MGRGDLPGRPYIIYYPLMAILYLVPTPLGDPDDITLRALRILREVSAVAADDANSAKKLLDSHQITTRIIPYSDALNALSSGDVAWVSQGGTPGIGDQSHGAVLDAIARGNRVEPLPGASAEITVLVLSGLPTDAFVYAGKLPDDLSRYAHEHDTMIFTTEDLILALERLLDQLGDRRVCVAANLTQPDEIVYRGVISAALVRFHLISGEFLLVIEGAPEEIAVVWDEARVRGALRQRLANGEPLKLAAKAVAGLAGWDRRAVYALGVDEKQNPP